MNIWINKCIEEEPIDLFEEPYIFNITNKTDSMIKSNMAKVWFDLGSQYIDSNYEDLYFIALIIFAIDKRFPRKNSVDCWTRAFNVSIPVINIEKWNLCRKEWESALRFLSGDIWSISFRKSNERYYEDTKLTLPPKIQENYDCISLFSGGLDSYCGAIKLLEESKDVCFIGYEEYPKLNQRQAELFTILEGYYPNHSKRLINFSGKAYSPLYKGRKNSNIENTGRSRSLLFICGALSIASILGEEMPLFIPENGFIGLNIPLTNSRKGSCSTRTTHVNFIKQLEEILRIVGINNKLENFFSYNSKKEVVEEVENTPAFIKGVEKTISCSRPCLPRWNRTGDNEYPRNCGYCYPCVIRKSSIRHLKLKNDKYTEHNSISQEFLKANDNFTGRGSDVRAVLTTIYRYNNISENELRRMVQCTGILDPVEVSKFIEVYKKSISELIDLIIESGDDKLLDDMKLSIGLSTNE